MTKRNDDILRMTAEIVVAYVLQNKATTAEVNDLLQSIHDSLTGLAQAGVTPRPKAAPTPAVPVSESIQPDFLLCLECGRRLRSLAFHLKSHGLAPDAYRVKWGLPLDYPMGAPSFKARRSAVAREHNFGKNRKDKARLAAPRRPATPAEVGEG